MSGEVTEMERASETVPGRRYKLHVQGDQVTCNCPGFTSHGHCKHADGARRNMDDEETTTALATREPDIGQMLIVQQPPTALLPSREDLSLMAHIAGTAVRAQGMIPANIKTPEQAMAVLLAGWELGLRPMTALRHVYVINGKTEIETRAMVGIIRSRDKRVRFAWPEYTSEAVTCEVQRPGQPITRVRYSREDAQASGQLAKGGPWKQYTRDMLYAAATKRACRLACPDLINAIEGAMTTTHEAESMMMPDAEVRVLDMPGEIPADAYNEGDDRALPPEVQQAVNDAGNGTERSRQAQHRTTDAPPRDVEQRATPLAQIAPLLHEAHQTLDDAARTALIKGLHERYPAAFNAKGGYSPMKLKNGEPEEVLGFLRRIVHGEPPPADGEVIDPDDLPFE